MKGRVETKLFLGFLGAFFRKLDFDRRREFSPINRKLLG